MRTLTAVLKPVIVLILLGAGTPLLAETKVYRSQNAQGNPVFSDRPEDGEAMVVQEPNSTPAVQPRPRPNREDSKDDNGRSYKMTITKPDDGTFIPNGLVPTEVALQLRPPLLPGHAIEFLVDGESVSSGANTHYRISRLTPGAHTLSARVLNADGVELSRADPVRVTTQWPSNNPRPAPSPRL